MPLTPLHWSVLLLGLLAFETVYLPALLVSSVLMDVEPAYYLFIAPNADGQLHGFFHTVLGATLMALAVAGLLARMRKPIDRIAGSLGLGQPKIGTAGIFASSVVAAWSHIILDATMHADMKPFWPVLDANPLLGAVPIGTTYLITGIGVIAVMVLTIQRIRMPSG